MATSTTNSEDRPTDRSVMELQKLHTERETMERLQKELTEEMRFLKHEQEYVKELLKSMEEPEKAGIDDVIPADRSNSPESDSSLDLSDIEPEI
ncbi:hypothetical protein BV898_15060 [Hypsibius exemplaris]|uniref:Uncharacterized protein n=1 Tax=Hypsibius exemplaris TaxID=2072580 RepID=A0A9X6NC89_HYPEX|nr:hypothetical protein BV898_15060 [Hypsibius exemplaris]